MDMISSSDQLYIFPYDMELYYRKLREAKEEVLISSQVLPNRQFCELLLGLVKKSVKLKILLTDPSYFHLFSSDEIAYYHNIHPDIVNYSKIKVPCGEENLYFLNQNNIYPHFINNKNFFLNHSKYILIDRKKGFVGSSIHGRKTKIDIVVETNRKEIVDNLIFLFNEDYIGKNGNIYQNHPDLLVAPINMREKLKEFIRKARYFIHILSPAVTDDEEFLQLFEEKIREGVKFKVLCSPHVFGIRGATYKSILDHFYLIKLQKLGGKIKMTYNPQIHSKSIFIDGKILYLGSANLRQSAFCKSREVGLFSREESVLRKITNFFDDSWGVAVDYQ